MPEKMKINTINEPLCQGDIIYFVLTDRFRDGLKGNNNGGNFNAAPSEPENPGKYHGGDLKGIIDSIPYLSKLGITALWITPVYLNIGECGDGDSYHGYWALDFDKIDPHLLPKGSDLGKKNLRELSDALHKHGIKLILDMVVNHTGYHTGNYKDYHKKGDFKPGSEWFGKNPGLSTGGLPDIDFGPDGKEEKPTQVHSDVRDFFVNNIIDWIEDSGIDAIRMDTIRYVEDAFWYYFKSYVRGKYRNVALIGEDLGGDIDEVAKYQKQMDIDCMFDFELTYNILDVMMCDHDRFNDKKELNFGMMCLASPRIHEWEEHKGILDVDTKKYTNANRLVTVLDNHDLEKRIMSWGLTKSGGNKEWAARLVRYVLAFQFTTRGIPCIYYGTELCLEGSRESGGDADLRKDFPWELIDKSTREPGKYIDRIKCDMYHHVKKLIELRKTHDSLKYGILFTLYVDRDFYAYMREWRGEVVITVLNNKCTDDKSTVEIDIKSNINIPSRIKNILNDRVLRDAIEKRYKTKCSNGKLSVSLKGKTARILTLF